MYNHDEKVPNWFLFRPNSETTSFCFISDCSFKSSLNPLNTWNQGCNEKKKTEQLNFRTTVVRTSTCVRWYVLFLFRNINNWLTGDKTFSYRVPGKQRKDYKSDSSKFLVRWIRWWSSKVIKSMSICNNEFPKYRIYGNRSDTSKVNCIFFQLLWRIIYRMVIMKETTNKITLFGTT